MLGQGHVERSLAARQYQHTVHQHGEGLFGLVVWLGHHKSDIVNIGVSRAYKDMFMLGLDCMPPDTHVCFLCIFSRQGGLL